MKLPKELQNKHKKKEEIEEIEWFEIGEQDESEEELESSNLAIIYVSDIPSNISGFLEKKLKKDLTKLDKNNKTFISALEKLKKNDIIKNFHWGVNLNEKIEIFIVPILKPIKPLILNLVLCTFTRNKLFLVKNDFFPESKKDEPNYFI